MGALLLIGLLLAALHVCGIRLCLFHRLTGRPCLTCGSTRAFAALLSGHIVRAIRIQPLATLTLLAALAAGTTYTGLLVFAKRIVTLHVTSSERRLLALLIVLLALLNWLYLLRHQV